MFGRLAIYICESSRFHLHSFKNCCLNSLIHLTLQKALQSSTEWNAKQPEIRQKEVKSWDVHRLCYRDAKQGTKNLMFICIRISFSLRRPFQCLFVPFSMHIMYMYLYVLCMCLEKKNFFFHFFSAALLACMYFGHRLNNIIFATQEAQCEHDEMHHRQMLYELTYSTKYVETITFFNSSNIKVPQ